MKDFGSSNYELKETMDQQKTQLDKIADNSVRTKALIGGIVSEGSNDIAITVIGDSTGNEETEWVYLLTEKLAEYANGYNVNYFLYDSVSGAYSKKVIKSLGESKKIVSTIGQYTKILKNDYVKIDESNHDVDVAIKIKMDFSTGASRYIMTKNNGNTSTECWSIVLNTSNLCVFYWTNESMAGGAMGYMGELATLPSDEEVYLRFVFDADNGSSSKTFSMYRSIDDGDTWTLLNSSTSAGTTTILKDESVPYAVLGKAYRAADATGEVSYIRLNAEIDGNNVFPIGFDYFEKTDANDEQDIEGYPTINIFNASVSGWGLSSFLNSDTLREVSQQAIKSTLMLSTSHNDLYDVGSALDDKLDLLFTAIKGYMYKPNIVILTQNPEGDSIDGKMRHAIRRNDLISYSNENNYDYIDTYGMFVDLINSGISFYDLINQDDIHPTNSGSEKWASYIYNLLT